MKKQLKTIVSIVLTFGMLFSAVPTSFISSGIVIAADASTATEEIHIWDGTSDVSWYDDEEIEFHISTPEQLAGLSELVNTGKTMENKIFVLDNDLYMNDVSAYDEWETTEPKNIFSGIGNFYGSIFGNNHIITGLYLKNALFSKLCDGYIADLHLEDIFILRQEQRYRVQDGEYTLAIGGMIDFSSNSSIVNCSIQGSTHISLNIERKSGVKMDNISYVGGLIGKSDSDKIINCSNLANISTENRIFDNRTYYLGGICGYSNSFLSSCTNNGNIDIVGKGYTSYMGGICGYSDRKISNCKNCGEINTPDESGINSLFFAGGICGGNNYGISNCYNTGKIGGYDDRNRSGGICGECSGSLENVYNVAESKYGIVYEAKSITNAYYLTGTASKGTKQTPDATIIKSEPNMKKESFANSLGDMFYCIDGEYPKLAFEVGRTVSEFDKTSLAFKEFGEAQKLELETTYLGEPEWVSSDTSVATVDSNGVVTAVGNGTTMIYALCSDSKAACSVTVGYDYYLSDNELSLKKGRVHDLAVYSASNGKEVTDIEMEWSSSDDSIISVDSKGTITTNAVGTAAIMAKVANVELSCIVSVYEYQIPIVIVPDDENAPKLSETDFTISTIDSKLLSVENYSDSITWISANTSIAKVSKNGLVKGVSEGNTAIYALLSDGRCLKASAIITKSEYTMGDVNLDGKFDVSDVVLLQKWLLAVPDAKLNHWENADFYEDGVINVFDLCLMKRKLLAQ